MNQPSESDSHDLHSDSGEPLPERMMRAPDGRMVPIPSSVSDELAHAILAKVSANIRAREAMMKAGIIAPTIGPTRSERAEPMRLKEVYLDNYGNSGVVGYEIGEDSIAVEFEDGSIYLYNHACTGSEAIRMMKQLAARGDGLNTYINLFVKDQFASRLD